MYIFLYKIKAPKISLCMHFDWPTLFAFRHDRQFRFEERDKSGNIKGLYGYYDKHGKLQMVNYDANPHDGFHAETPVGNF